MNNLQLTCTNFGGVFSKMMLLIQNASLYNTADCYKLIVRHTNDTRYNFDENLLDHIFEQVDDSTNFVTIACKRIPSYNSINPIEHSSNYSKYKEIVSRLQFKQTLLSEVDSIARELDITDDTIGMHVRLTDMNSPDHANKYGYFSLDDYMHVLESRDIGRIFVASDNHESIDKLSKHFDVRYCKNFTRAKTETDDMQEFWTGWLSTKRHWEEAFIEMLLLAKCNGLICRTSNLANYSIVMSDTIKEVIRL